MLKLSETMIKILSQFFILLVSVFVVCPVYSGEYTNFIGMTFNDIRAGSFFMGSCVNNPENNQPECNDKSLHDSHALSNELPRRKIEISNNFQIGVKEVTVGQFMSFVNKTTRSQFSTLFFSLNNHGDDKPIIFVSWTDTQDFLHWLNNEKPISDHALYRLATEAEWEYVARANSENIFSFGNSNKQLLDYAWYDKNSLDKGANHPPNVGSKRENSWGVYDMSGNVWEWVSDWYDHEYYNKGENRDPAGPDTGFLRVVRGGAWNFSAEYCRVAARDGYPSDGRSVSLGFRIIREVH